MAQFVKKIEEETALVSILPRGLESLAALSKE
jgi:hypothetical protein